MNTLIREMSQLLDIQRAMIYDAIDEVLQDTFGELGDMMLKYEKMDGERVDFRRAVAGVPASILNEIRDHAEAGDLHYWMTEGGEGRSARLKLAFLNANSLSAKDFREKFPNAFCKWTEADDARLKEMWEAGTPWVEMSNIFGRNVNALKLRLQRLGVDLGPDAGRPRR